MRFTFHVINRLLKLGHWSLSKLGSTFSLAEITEENMKRFKSCIWSVKKEHQKNVWTVVYFFQSASQDLDFLFISVLFIRVLLEKNTAKQSVSVNLLFISMQHSTSGAVGGDKPTFTKSNMMTETHEYKHRKIWLTLSEWFTWVATTSHLLTNHPINNAHKMAIVENKLLILHCFIWLIFRFRSILDII